MCKHCANLREDKQIVHAFAASAANRINEKWESQGIGYTPISADDLDIRVDVTKREPMRGYSLLKELTREP